MSDEEAGVQVAVRMRIFNQREKDAHADRIVRMTREEVGSKTFIKHPDTGDEKEFKFDFSFNSHANDPSVGPYSTQDDVFDLLGRPVLMSALEGRNVCLFAYGQTGAGKSFSMLGKSQPPEMQGIIPRTCREIFKVIDQHKDDPLVTAKVGIQVVEIYCEQVNDLLADRKKWPPAGHKPRLTKDGYTVDTICQPCSLYEDIESAFTFADKNRSVGSHALNPESSRAHTIYQINYEKKTKASADAKQCETISTRLNLVDLAGSERMELAGTSGQMLKEGNAINLSLTALGNCIKALSENKRPNFRDSKLTLLLQSCMTNGKVIMIAALSPASICYDESVSTLRFAERIKTVKIKSKKNVTLDPVAEIKKEMEEMRQRMQDEINDLKRRAEGKGDPEEVERLRSALEEQRQSEHQLRDDMDRRVKEMNETDEDRNNQKAAISNQWQKALGGASMLNKDQITTPHLLNLNEDPRLAETLVYQLAEGNTLVGRSNKDQPPTLEFNGMGILKNHCLLKWDKAAGTVHLVPGDGNPSCIVNGLNQTGECELKHNYRVWLGNNYAFRFAFPGCEDKTDEKLEIEGNPDYFFAEEEIARQKSEGGSALNHQLTEALKKVDQANIIANDLSRDCKFATKILKDRQTGDDVVVVNIIYPTGELHWPWDKFQVRLTEMVQVWQNWQYAQSEGTAYVLPAEGNPFIDDEPQLIGEADVYNHSLRNMIDFECKAAILSPTAQKVGQLLVEIKALDENGNEGPWEDEDNEDLDPYVESLAELKGKNIQFAIKISKVVWDVDITKDGGKCKYADTWVRYKLNPDDPAEDWSATTHCPDPIIEPKLDHSKKFKKMVDDNFEKLLTTRDRFTFQVWGKLAMQQQAIEVTPILPEGWKKVTAYQDPEGKLHLEPPQV